MAVNFSKNEHNDNTQSDRSTLTIRGFDGYMRLTLVISDNRRLHVSQDYVVREPW